MQGFRGATNTAEPNCMLLVKRIPSHQAIRTLVALRPISGHRGNLQRGLLYSWSQDPDLTCI